MLVNTHKRIFLIFAILIGWGTASAQETMTLQQCIDSALVQNKTLQINRNNVAISEQREKEAVAGLIPKISGQADYRYFLELPTQLMPVNALNPTLPEGQYKAVQFGVPHNVNASLMFSMPLYNPQLYGAIKSVKTAGEITGIQLHQSEEQVVYDITTLYYNAQILKHQLRFVEENLANTNQLLKIMELLKSQLLARGSDVKKVNLQREQLITQRENASIKYLQVINALKLNMGVRMETKFDVVENISLQVADDHISNKVTDIQMLESQNRLLRTELSTLKRSVYLPSLNLVGSYGTSGFGYDRKPNDFLKFYPVGFAGLQLSYPLFNGTVTQRKIRRKKLELGNNELQTQLIAEKNKMETENMTRQKLVAKKTIADTEKQIELAQSIYQQTLLQQKEGTASITDVLLADASLRESQQNYLSAVIDYLKADIELKRATGNIGN